MYCILLSSKFICGKITLYACGAEISSTIHSKDLTLKVLGRGSYNLISKDAFSSD